MCYTNGDTEFEDIDFDDLRKVMNEFKSKTRPIDIIITVDSIYQALIREYEKNPGNEPASSKKLEGHKLRLLGIPIESYATTNEARLKRIVLAMNGKKVQLLLEKEDTEELILKIGKENG